MMTAAFPSFFSRRLGRVLAVLAALAALGGATLAALMFFWVLPNIASHRDTVAQLMTRALGQRVTLEAVSGDWQQRRPAFRLRGVRLYDAQGQAALVLPELKAEFSWRSLLLLELRFNQIELQGLELGVRRAADRHFYIGGIPVNPADPGSGLSSWLLRQGRVQVSQATLVWRDALRPAPPLIFTDVALTLDNTRRHHHLQLRATPPARLARPLTVDAEIRTGDVEDPTTWNGRVTTSIAGVAFPHLLPWLEWPAMPRQGWGALNLVLDIQRGALTGVRAGLDVRQIETVLGTGLPALKLDQVRGQAQWRRDAQGMHLDFDNVRVALPGQPLSPAFGAGLIWGGASRQIVAQAFNLAGWQSVLPSLPMDAALRTQLTVLQPRGRLDSLRLGWQGAQPGADNFRLDARFSGLSVNATTSTPGMTNLSGQIEGDARAGRFSIDSQKLLLDLPEVFRDPLLTLDRVQASGGWKKTARGRQLILDSASFANPDLAGSARGRYEQIAGQRGVIDLSAHLTRAEGTRVYRYFPRSVGDLTVNWLKDGVIKGYSDDVRLTLRGDLAHFPFEAGQGEFRVDAQIKDAIIDYVSGWPRIDGIQARLLFVGKTMEVTSKQARIFTTDLPAVRVFIPDLLHHDEQLRVTGDARGPAADFVRFANSSPLATRLRGITTGLDGKGPMHLALNLQVPLRHSIDTTVNGKLSFLGSSLTLAGLPRIDQIRGAIDFTDSGLSARQIAAQFLGGPLRVDAHTRNDQVQILAQGQATAAGLIPWLGSGWSARLSGQTAWRGQIDLLPTGEKLQLESTLLGLASALPAPLAKSAAQSLPFHFSSQPDAGGRRQALQLGSTVNAVWRVLPDRRFDRGEIRFGGAAASLPAEPDLRVAGNGRGLDISAWMAWLPDNDGEAPLRLNTLDLSFDTIDLMGRRYSDIRLQGRTRNGLLRTQVNGHEIDGVVTYRAQGEEAARVSAQFRQFTLPATTAAPGVTSGAVPGSNLNAVDFPVLDITVDDFRLPGRALGRLEVVAHGAPQGLVIDKLQLRHPDSLFQMTGLWRDTGAGETRADLSLAVSDAGKFLARFGYPDAVKRGSVDIQGNATWEGTPADFDFATLAGQMDFKAKGGQFLKVEPGVGKLLGVLSLQSLPRRLNFDFRDIFNDGYAFDDMSATLRIARGVVYSDDFRMRGPAAKVGMSGLANLNQETVQLRLKVLPKLSEGVAIAGALVGGPLAGVGALAAQKLLRDPIEEIISQEYLVAGSWLAPDVKRLPKTGMFKGKADKQASEP